MKNEFINSAVMLSAVILFLLFNLVFFERYVRNTKHYTKFLLFKSWSTKIVITVLAIIYFYLLFTS